MIINLPFDGFYNSRYSEDIDREESNFIEWRTDAYEASDEDYEAFWPEALRLDGYEMSEILIRVSNYSVAYKAIAEQYVDAFDYAAGELLEMKQRKRRKAYSHSAKKFYSEWYDCPTIGLRFESMTSPKFYNFETDKIFAHIPQRTIKELFKRSKADNHATLAKVIKSYCTSYSGFMSFYSNQLADWLEKPLKQWDHNEVQILLIAIIEQASGEEIDGSFRDEIYNTISDGGFYSEWEKCVDWSAFDKQRLEARAEKLVEWLDQDNESALQWSYNNAEMFSNLVNAAPASFPDISGVSYRCPMTEDLFNNVVK
jgi:hypothetical protein